jgi:ankyrin repeat protein
MELYEILDAGDARHLAELLAGQPGLASARMGPLPGHPSGASPLGYVAMLRYDAVRGEWRDVTGTAELACVLIAAGAPVDGTPDERETPLITAASYGDAAVAVVLIEAGADLEAHAAADSGGVPGGTALLHAAVFGMTDVVDVLVAAGAGVDGIEVAAAAGEVGAWLDDASEDARIRALVMAADHERLEVIDALVGAGTPVDATDREFGRQPLRTAAANGRPASVRRLLAHGADPSVRDAHGRTPLDLCRTGTTPAHREVEAILTPLATT